MNEKTAILCVDDEVIILTALVRELKMAFGNRFLYEQATDALGGLQAVEDLAAEGIRVILILSDWLMPGMKGDEFLEKVQERHPGIAAVVITGQADQAAIDRLKANASIRAVLPKPWNSAELKRIIEESASEA